MFHNAQNCPSRNAIIIERQKYKQIGPEIPEQRYGGWMIEEKLVPEEAFQNARMGIQVGNTRGAAILSKLQALFTEVTMKWMECSDCGGNLC